MIIIESDIITSPVYIIFTFLRLLGNYDVIMMQPMSTSCKNSEPLQNTSET